MEWKLDMRYSGDFGYDCFIHFCMHVCFLGSMSLELIIDEVGILLRLGSNSDNLGSFWKLLRQSLMLKNFFRSLKSLSQP